jgi:MFS family permease
MTLGTVVAGWLSDRLQRRKRLLIMSSVIQIPVIWLIGRTTTIWPLAVITASVWFLVGMGLTLLRILAGLFARKTERGRVFGVFSLAGASGSLIGGVTLGPVADRWGYPTMFTALALFSCLLPLTALLLKDKVVVQDQRGETSISRKKTRLGGNFFLLFLASIIAGIVAVAGGMGTSLTMNNFGFAAAAISSTGAIAGAVTLPLPLLVGWLSDRFGRKRVLACCYLVGAVSMLILVKSIALWHFWVAAALRRFAVSVGRVIGSALTTDLVPQESLGKGISLFSATTWIGGIIGFAGTGYTIQYLGLIPTFILGAFLPLVAIILLIPIRQAKQEEISVPELGKRAD